MSLPRKRLLLATSLVFLGLTLGAQESAPEVFRGRVSALEARPFRIGELEIRVMKFWPNSAFGTRQLVFRLENFGATFLPVLAEDLVVVGRDGQQVQEIWPMGLNPLPFRTRIAPRAHVTLRLYPDNSVKYPARLYFGERLLAEITE